MSVLLRLLLYMSLNPGFLRVGFSILLGSGSPIRTIPLMFFVGLVCQAITEVSFLLGFRSPLIRFAICCILCLCEMVRSILGLMMMLLLSMTLLEVVVSMLFWFLVLMPMKNLFFRSFLLLWEWDRKLNRAFGRHLINILFSHWNNFYDHTYKKGPQIAALS